MKSDQSSSAAIRLIALTILDQEGTEREKEREREREHTCNSTDREYSRRKIFRKGLWLVFETNVRLSQKLYCHGLKPQKVGESRSLYIKRHRHQQSDSAFRWAVMSLPLCCVTNCTGQNHRTVSMNRSHDPLSA